MADHHSQENIDDHETSEIPKLEGYPVSQTEQRQENPDSIAKIHSKGKVQDHVINKWTEESGLPDAYKDDQHLSRFPIYPNESISLSSGSRSICSRSDERKNDRFRLVGLSLEMFPRLRDFRESLEMMMMESSEMADKTLSEKECILTDWEEVIDALDEAEIEDYSLKEKLEKKEKKVEKLSSKLEKVRLKTSSLKEQLDDMIKKMSTNATSNKSDEEQKPISSEQFMGTVPVSTLSPPSSDDEASSPSGSNCDGGTQRLVSIYQVMMRNLLAFKGMKEMERKMEELDDMIKLLGEAMDTDKERQEEIEKNQKMVPMLRFELKQEKLMASRLELQLDVMRMRMTNKDQDHSAKRVDADAGYNKKEQRSPTGAGERDDD